MVSSTYDGWYVGKIHAAADTVGPNSYADCVALNVPVDTGYRVFVYYRATSGDPWGLYGMSPGTVDVTAGFTAITVTAPTGTHEPGPGQRPAGHLDDQRGGGHGRVQPLGGDLHLRRLVRGQDPRRRRHRRPRQLRRLAST